MHPITHRSFVVGMALGASALCQPSIAQAPQTPVADIVGLKVGSSYEQIVEALEARDDVSAVETAQQWLRQSHGVATRQLLRASDGTACAEGETARKTGGKVQCETTGGHFQGRKGVTHEIVVAFAGMPGKESAVSIWRRSAFPKDAAPTVAALEQALHEKYGKPHVRQTESGYWSMTHRAGAINLNWIYLPNGRPITGNDALRHRCVNGPKPWFTTKHSWNKGCGMTVRAEIRPQPGSRLLAGELNVSVVEQRALIGQLGRFDADLKRAVEESSRGKAKKLDF